MAQAAPVQVFCSFAPEDEPLCLELERRLKLLHRQGLLTLWHRGHIPIGADQASATMTALKRAALILLLISPDYLSSDDCYEVELTHAMHRHEAGTARVIPILLRPIEDRQATPFGHLAVLPTNAQPLTRWPDRDEAFADVVAGIRRAISDLPASALGSSPVPLPQVWTIPYLRNPVFTGRKELLDQLATQLQAGQTMALTQPPQAISGLGGVGKTQLAVEYAYQHRADYQAVLWARAESTEALTSSCVTLAKELNLSQKDERDTALIVAAVQQWLRTNTSWLLILDNADDLAVVREFLPPDYKGHVLLTTRAQAMGRLAQRLDVDTLPPELGALFLLRRAGRLAPTASLDQASPPDREAAYAITHELGGLPLALDQAGAYIEETGCRLADYRQFYQQHRAELLRERRGQVADHPEAVATTWSLAFQRIEQAQPAAADLLRLCAFLAPDAIPEELLTQGATHLGPLLAPVAADPFRLNQTFEALRAYSLIKRDPEGKTLSIHRLVQAVLQDSLEERQQRTWAKRVLRAVNATFPKVEHGMWPQCERLLPQVMTVAQLVEQYQLINEEVGRLFSEAASYLQDRVRYAQAEALYQRALHIQEQQVGPEHPLVAFTLNNLVSLYYSQGKYTQAEPLYQRALALLQQQVGPDNPRVALARNNLARLYSKQGEYTLAEPLYQDALALLQQQVGPDHLLVASPLNGLADLYREQGKYAQAEALYQRALHIREQQVGPDDSQVASPLNGLADLYREQGKYAQAEALYQRALAILQRQMGPDHPLVASPLNGLADLYREQGKYARAEPLYERALAISEKQLGPTHPNTASSLNDLAVLYVRQGKYAQAEPLYERALAIREEYLGPTHPHTAQSLNNLAALYVKQGKDEQAEPLCQRALAIYEERLGLQHRDTRIVRGNYVRFLRRLGRDAEADQVEARSMRRDDSQVE